jgi:hypothetical protein
MVSARPQALPATRRIFWGAVSWPYPKTMAAKHCSDAGVAACRHIDEDGAQCGAPMMSVAARTRLRPNPPAGLCRAHTLRVIGRQQQPRRPSSKQRCRATSKHSRDQCRNYAMMGKGVCHIRAGATPPWRWRTVTLWDGERGRIVEKRVRVVRTPEHRERERRAKLEHKIAKYAPAGRHGSG